LRDYANIKKEGKMKTMCKSISKIYKSRLRNQAEPGHPSSSVRKLEVGLYSASEEPATNALHLQIDLLQVSLQDDEYGIHHEFRLA